MYFFDFPLENIADFSFYLYLKIPIIHAKLALKVGRPDIARKFLEKALSEFRESGILDLVNEIIEKKRGTLLAEKLQEVLNELEQVCKQVGVRVPVLRREKILA